LPTIHHRILLLRFEDAAPGARAAAPANLLHETSVRCQPRVTSRPVCTFIRGARACMLTPALWQHDASAVPGLSRATPGSPGTTLPAPFRARSDSLHGKQPQLLSLESRRQRGKPLRVKRPGVAACPFGK
jgi:hypothetical protein